MNAVVQQEAARLPSLQSGGAVRAIVPQDFEGAWRIATAVVKAGMAPHGLETPEKAMVAIMHGMEVGMTPMAALQSIAVVNGRPTIWGDGAIGLVRGSGKLEWIKERIEGQGDKMVAVCEVKRKGEPDVTKATFSVEDAKKAQLWGKTGRNGQPTPWVTYPKRMLAMRARAFALRDAFADVLRGLGIAEEVQDTPMRDVTPPPPKPPVPPAPPSEPAPESASDDAGASAEIDPRETVPETGEDTGAVMDEGPFDPHQFFEDLETALAGAMDAETVEEVWSEMDVEATFDGDDINLQIASKIKDRRLKQIGGSNG